MKKHPILTTTTLIFIFLIYSDLPRNRDFAPLNCQNKAVGMQTTSVPV
jgi:hypothetical protein